MESCRFFKRTMAGNRIIFTEKLNISSEIRASAIEGIYDSKKWIKEERDALSNLIVNIRTHWSFHTDNDAAGIISDTIFSAIICNKREWITKAVWGATYNRGEYAVKHSHGEEGTSWVYYLSCCNKCAPLVFDEKEIIPETDLLVYFSSEIEHEVPEQKCNHERIILAGNIKKDKTMMTWEEAY